MAELSAAEADLFRGPNFGVVATISADGAAQVSVVWVDCDGDDVLFNTAVGRAKPRNLARDPRCSVLVTDHEDPYEWVAVRGWAEVSPEGGDEHIDKLARKYTGSGWTPRPGQQRLVVRVHPEQVTSYTERS
jgi:PPOX class probable F420-dependent enzyme